MYPGAAGGPQYGTRFPPARIPYPSALQQMSVEKSRSPSVQEHSESSSDLAGKSGSVVKSLVPLEVETPGGNTVVDALLQQVRWSIEKLCVTNFKFSYQIFLRYSHFPCMSEKFT